MSIKGERPLDGIISEYGFSADDAKNASEAAKKLIGVDKLGDRCCVVGLRGKRDAKRDRPRLVQVSVNAPDKYFGTISCRTTAPMSPARTRGSTTTFRNTRKRTRSRQRRNKATGCSTRSTAPPRATAFRAA